VNSMRRIEAQASSDCDYRHHVGEKASARLPSRLLRLSVHSAEPKLPHESEKAPRVSPRGFQGRNEEGFLKPSRIHKVLTMPPAFPALGHGVNTDVEPARWTCWLKNDVSSPRSVLIGELE
jgi:hypothetical protein